jgi:hypothetical protein
LTFAVIAVVYRREFLGAQPVRAQEVRVHVHRPLLWKSVATSTGMVLLFFAG